VLAGTTRLATSSVFTIRLPHHPVDDATTPIRVSNQKDEIRKWVDGTRSLLRRRNDFSETKIYNGLISYIESDGEYFDRMIYFLLNVECIRKICIIRSYAEYIIYSCDAYVFFVSLLFSLSAFHVSSAFFIHACNNLKIKQQGFGD